MKVSFHSGESGVTGRLRLESNHVETGFKIVYSYSTIDRSSFLYLASSVHFLEATGPVGVSAAKADCAG